MAYKVSTSNDFSFFPTGLKVAMVMVVIMFTAIGLRLFKLQVLSGDQYRTQAMMNQLRVLPLNAPRGKILDRRGRILADVRPAFSVTVIPGDIQDEEGLAQSLGTILGIPEQQIADKILKVKGLHRYRPLVVARDIPRSVLARLESRLYHMPGVKVIVEGLRWYPYDSMAAHVLGYVGEISSQELEKQKEPSYWMGDLIGKTGLEKVYQDILRGKNGYRVVEVDSLGREVREVQRVPPIPGNDIITSLDLDLQSRLEEWLPPKGAAVVLKIESGETMAMVSHPSFDPNDFATGVSEAEWQQLSMDPDHPLTNRAIQGFYPPGSVFKAVVALAALTEGVITPEETVTCVGQIERGTHQYRCWKEGGHGEIALHRALVESCDVYFYLVGEKVGPRSMARWGTEMGLGKKSGIDLPGEKAGLVPDPDWKKKNLGDIWFPGETYHMAIGQGYFQITPLQVARLMSVLGSGKLLPPRLLNTSWSPQDGTLKSSSISTPPTSLPVPENVLEAVRLALRGVVSEPFGTGTRARVPDLEVAGKTGTAQVVSRKDDEEEELPEELRDHAWFGAFAPASDPEFALVVLVEHGEHGGSAAAPGAALILKTLQELDYFPFLIEANVL